MCILCDDFKGEKKKIVFKSIGKNFKPINTHFTLFFSGSTVTAELSHTGKHNHTLVRQNRQLETQRLRPQASRACIRLHNLLHLTGVTLKPLEQERVIYATSFFSN